MQKLKGCTVSDLCVMCVHFWQKGPAICITHSTRKWPRPTFVCHQVSDTDKRPSTCVYKLLWTIKVNYGTLTRMQELFCVVYGSFVSKFVCSVGVLSDLVWCLGESAFSQTDRQDQASSSPELWTEEFCTANFSTLPWNFNTSLETNASLEVCRWGIKLKIILRYLYTWKILKRSVFPCKR